MGPCDVEKNSNLDEDLSISSVLKSRTELHRRFSVKRLLCPNGGTRVAVHKFGYILCALMITLLSSTNTADAQDIYKSDQGHTEVFFGWSHVGVSRQHGEFTKASATLTLVPDNLEESNISVTIDPSSVFSGVAVFDEHLKGQQFLNVEKFPEATFQSTSIEMTGEKTAKVTGDLTLHGVTKSVVLDTRLTHRGSHPVAKFFEYYKGEWLAFHATTKIDHQAFGIGAYSTGPISIEIHTELQRQ
jgi:polyisoprenoid-binding protein YceI